MVCALYEFFDYNVVLPGAAAGIFVGRASFFDVGGSVDAFATSQINGFDDDREGELRNRCIKICGVIPCGISASDFDGNRAWCRYSESCCKCTVLVLMV